MGRMWSQVGVVVVGLLSCIPMAQATRIVEPPQPIAWVIESADYTGEIEDQIARIQVRYTIRVIQDRWTEIPLTLQGGRITAIDIKKGNAGAHIVPRGSNYVFATAKKGTYTVELEFSHRLTQDSQFEGVQLGIPRATFSTLNLFVPRKDVELRLEDELYVERTTDGRRGGVRLIARLGAANQMALRWRTKPVAPEHIEPAIYGTVQTMVTLEEQLAKIFSIVEYRISQGETDALTIHVPSGLAIRNVRGAGIEEWKVTDGTSHQVLHVQLSDALKETTYRLVVEAEQNLEEHQGTYQLPAMTLTGVKQERGYIGVARDGSIEIALDTLTGINRIDVQELPQVLASTGSSPALLAFRYQRHPFEVTLSMTHHEDHPVLAAIAERADLVTVLSRQGELLTRASYLIRANKKQFLEVRLPEGATLWSCLVAGESVKPVEGDDETLLVPLTHGTQASHTVVPVELVYFERGQVLERLGRLQLEGPVLDVPSTVANWSVYTPKSVRWLRVRGNLEHGMASYDYLDEPFTMVRAQGLRGRGVFAQGAYEEQHFGDRNDDQSRNKFFRSVRSSRQEMDEVGDGERRHNGWAIAGMARKAAAELPPLATEHEALDRLMSQSITHASETGILPLKVRLPRAGSVHRFNRLLTTADALTLDVTFLHLPMPWLPFAALGLVLLPIGGVVVARTRRV